MPNFNAFMHRRNIFRKEPDFKKLACDYQELRQFMTVGSKGKTKFDFKNPDALRALTCALLHRYFQKRIRLPNDRMIPAVPQRLNYICWIEDLVKLVECQSSDLNVLGIDIGTGASCIFPILSCHRNPTWSFIGVEADAKSHSIAVENVQKNFMDDKIRMLKISTEDTLNDILCLSCQPVTFIMCNPPFFEEEYGVTLEMSPNIVSVGRPKSNSNVSDRIESVVSGGEIAFVGRMLDQSRHLKEEVTIYSSMLGRKQSLTHFKQTLSSMNEDNLTWTWAELCQGKTIRYAIAWSFKPGLDLTRAPPLRHGKNKSWKFKLLRKMPKRDCQLEMLENILFLKNLISRELMIVKARVSRQNAQTFEMLIKTNERTWTNQRRKRREQANKHKHQATSSTIHFDTSKLTSSSQEAGDSDSLLLTGANNHTQMICDVDHRPTIGAQRCDNNNSNYSNDDVKMNTIETTSNDLMISSASRLNQSAHQAALSINLTDSGPAVGHTLGVDTESSNQSMTTNSFVSTPTSCSKKRKNPSSCSSSPSRICPSPNDELTDDDNQSTDNSDVDHEQNDDSMNDVAEIKRICLKDGSDDCENMDDIYDYLLCCRISLSRVCHDLYFELKLEHPCTAANDAYDLFQYFRNKLTEK